MARSVLWPIDNHPDVRRGKSRARDPFRRAPPTPFDAAQHFHPLVSVALPLRERSVNP
jgi:hypothetical protein